MKTQTPVQSFKIQVVTEISFQRIADLICCGMEGGIGYWSRIVGYDKPSERAFAHSEEVYRHIEYPLNPGGAVKLEIDDPIDNKSTQTIYKLDLKAIKRGLDVMNEKYPRHMANFLQENEDADTGDVFIQCCLFGEVVFG